MTPEVGELGRQDGLPSGRFSGVGNGFRLPIYIGITAEAGWRLGNGVPPSDPAIAVLLRYDPL